MLSQIHVKFLCQRPQHHFQVFGLDFSAFSTDWACVLYCASCSFQFSIMAIQSEFSFVSDKITIGNFCDGFENILDYCPGGEESNTEEKEDLDGEGLTLAEAAL